MSYKFSDSLSLRIINIFQEAILTGVDGADLLRQVRVQVTDDNSLVMTPEYEAQVKDMHKKLLEQAAEKQRGQIDSKPSTILF